MTRQSVKRAHQKEIAAIPFFGRSWYRRGLSYWLRRVVFTLALCGVLALFTTITWSLVKAIAIDESVATWAKVIILAVVAAAIVRSMFKAWSAFSMMNRARKRGVAMSLAEASGEPRAQSRERRRGAVSGSGALGTAAMLGGGALLVVSVVFNFGWGVIFVLLSLQKYLTPEEFAKWQEIKHKRTQTT